MNRHRPRFHPAWLAGALALAAAGPAPAADCRLKYRLDTSSSLQTESVNAGQTKSLNRNGLIEGPNDGGNDGGNDSMLMLENLGAQSSVALLRSDSQTLPLPPLLFTGQRLLSAQGRNGATVTDAQRIVAHRRAGAADSAAFGRSLDGESGVFTQPAEPGRLPSRTLRRLGDGDSNESNGSER
jgi:hypothetical protein